MKNYAPLDERKRTDLMFPVGSVVSHIRCGEGVVVERYDNDNKHILVCFRNSATMPFSNSFAPKVFKLKEPKYSSGDLKLLKREVECGRNEIVDFIVDSLGFDKAMGYLVPDVMEEKMFLRIYSQSPVQKPSEIGLTTLVTQSKKLKPVVVANKVGDSVAEQSGSSGDSNKLGHDRQAVGILNKEDWPYGTITIQ